MFTGRPLPPLPTVVAEAGWAAGSLHVCQQSALEFGSNRREPVNCRPVVKIRPDGHRVVVLPCTRRDQAANPDFFDLNASGRVMWSLPPKASSFTYYRYETVSSDALVGKAIGVMSHPARINLIGWLKERY